MLRVCNFQLKHFFNIYLNASKVQKVKLKAASDYGNLLKASEIWMNVPLKNRTINKLLWNLFHEKCKKTSHKGCF